MQLNATLEGFCGYPAILLAAKLTGQINTGILAAVNRNITAVFEGNLVLFVCCLLVGLACAARPLAQWNLHFQFMKKYRHEPNKSILILFLVVVPIAIALTGTALLK